LIAPALNKGRAWLDGRCYLSIKDDVAYLKSIRVYMLFSVALFALTAIMGYLAQNPDLVLLDEPESGVDLENIALIGQLINESLGKSHPINRRTRSGLIISHTGYILEYVNARTGYVLYGGQIICEGDPRDILNNIKEKGYQECVACLKK